jgi:hypothetical protein
MWDEMKRIRSIGYERISERERGERIRMNKRRGRGRRV